MQARAMRFVRRIGGRLLRARSRNKWVLLVGLMLVAGWQISFGNLLPTDFDGTHRVTASVGVQTEPLFFFYLYHLGLYPVAADPAPKVDTKAEALRLLREKPQTIFQEFGLTFASGERGRTYLYFVDGWLHHNALKPALRPANALAFGVALCGLFLAFWSVGRPLAGAVFVALLGSNPFQLDAIHGQDNVFSWSITAMIGLLALHVPLVERGRKPWRLVLGIAIASGIFMGLVRHVRSEPTPLLAAPILIYATLSRAKLRERLLPMVAMLVFFFGTSAAISKRLETKFYKAQQTVASVGAVPYKGPLVFHHEFWHPVFCGLGDFDTTHGYAWDDRKAYAYALGIAEKRAGKKLDYNPTFWAQKQSYDGKGRYPIPFFEALPDFHAIVREKVLGDIRKDPKWYLDILGKRVVRILTTTTPITLTFGKKTFAFASAWLGGLSVVLLAFLLATKRFADVKLLLFATPLSVAALLVYSDKGMTSYSCFHLVAAAIVVGLAGELVMRAIRGPAAPRWR